MTVFLFKKNQKPKQIIHHKNQNQLEDRIGNLESVSIKTHGHRHTRGETFISLICPTCLKQFNVLKRRTQFVRLGYATNCSRSCGHKFSRLPEEIKLKHKNSQKILQEFQK